MIVIFSQLNYITIMEFLRNTFFSLFTQTIGVITKARILKKGTWRTACIFNKPLLIQKVNVKEKKKKKRKRKEKERKKKKKKGKKKKERKKEKTEKREGEENNNKIIIIEIIQRIQASEEKSKKNSTKYGQAYVHHLKILHLVHLDHFWYKNTAH